MPKAIHGSYVTKVVTLLASSARTASADGSATGTSLATYPITGDNKGFTQAAKVFLDCTASSGTTPTLDVVIQGRTSASGTWITLDGARFNRLTTTGTECLTIDGPLPPELRASATIGGSSPSFTFSVIAVLGG